jgi:diadenosine tetraphosphate (Ap4A) HIT family hydrolase
LRTELKPETANQHGRLYLPTPTEQAIIVVTDFRIDRPMAIPSSSTEFFKACFLTDEDAQTAHVQEPRAVADTLIDRRVAAAHRGENPYVIARLPTGWAVAGDRQVVHGYCLLLPDPVVPDLNALRGPARSQFLLDMVSLGDALLEVTGAQRINYEILGNLEPALHAHLFPRYDAEPEDLRRRPVWFYDWSQAPIFDPDSYSTFVHTVRSALRRRHV